MAAHGQRKSSNAGPTVDRTLCPPFCSALQPSAFPRVMVENFNYFIIVELNKKNRLDSTRVLRYSVLVRVRGLVQLRLVTDLDSEMTRQSCHTCTLQYRLVLCQISLLPLWVAVTLPELVPWNHVQDPVPAIHRQPRQQPTFVRLACK